jgi:hypothetical protein
MKRNTAIVNVVILLLSVSCSSKNGNNSKEWKIADNPIVTQWAGEINPDQPWPEYPRPDAVREEWINLNGLWDYAITGSEDKPSSWDGKILVPYPVESALSGIKRNINDKQYLWYKRSFRIPSSWKKRELLLNFEASDWETTVWVDGKEAGKHKGGYDPFTFNITPFLDRGKNHELLVKVWDPTDKGYQPRGKQVSEPTGIWYTSTTGIWQTVWLEPVNESYIRSFRYVSDIENGIVTVSAEISGASSDQLKVSVMKDDKAVSYVTGNINDPLKVIIPDFKLWTPENPVLYKIVLEVYNGSKLLDRVTGSAGLRKISLGKTADGFTRILLNNRFIYQNGPLDQGFWPDGIYTPPSMEAMTYDLEMIRKMGFNMLRKHVKVENRIFYNQCDKMGILVWQDMPSGDSYISGDEPDITRSEESTEQFEYELKRMIETKYNHPSIIMWIPFNEGWGQFETGRITNFIKGIDSTRLVNSSSGWTDRGTGDIKDIHHYPEPAVPATEDGRALVLGEFGGLGLPVQGHTWEQKNWGYRNMEDTIQLLEKYESFYDQVYRYVKESGLSATVYTQITDVETETNGLLTYDRKINKMGVENVFKANNDFLPPVLKSPVRIFTENFEVNLSNYRPGGTIYYSTDSTEPSPESKIYDKSFVINQPAVIKAFTRWKEADSRVSVYTIQKTEPIHPVDVYDLKPGLIASVYYGDFEKLPDFHSMKPAFNKTITEISNTIAKRDELFAIEFEGYLLIPADDVYGLSLVSDDGSRLLLNGKEILSNDGIHGMQEESGYFPLGKGHHKLRLEYFQRKGGVGLKLLIEVPGHQKSNIPEPWLKH